MTAYLIRVPATTANLGPGFDCLGVALDLWNELEIEATGQQLNIEIEGYGAACLPKTQENAIYQAMLAFAQHNGCTLPQGLHFKCRNAIPVGSGLGSSSAAIVAGILATSAVLALPTTLESHLDYATHLEGHPDNITPCLMGGLVTAMLDGKNVFARSLPIAPFDLVLVHPLFSLPTAVARSVLPKTLSYADSIFNTSHALLLGEALRSGDLALLNAAMKDRLHQPYRLPMIPGACAAFSAAEEAGAAAVVISGAGPSLLAFSPNAATSPAIARAMQNAFTQNGLKSEAFFPRVSATGASVEVR